LAAREPALPALSVVQRDTTGGPPAATDPPLTLYAPPRAEVDGGTADGFASPGATAMAIAATSQRAVTEPAVATPPSVQAASAPAAPGGGGGGAHSEADMEELARRLYEHIGTRLRAELLVERERAGMVTDLR
jgi:hypothetical protein